MAQWQSRGVTAVAVGVECGANIGPSASLLRFSLVAPLLETYDVPIVVLDLDAVVEQSLRGLLESIGHVDVASRILGYGVAPWEKYTGGFAVFRPTTSGRKVADYVARAAATLVRPGAPQWWIDQNCFEAGIRLASEEGELVVHNVMSVRDRYCTMPVGPAAAKEHALRNAMDRIVSGASHG
ncbi:hypothetical protein [Cellulomonas sp. ATA003]|uniref:hypothetical protein n=1 Tax=Cellulomonas sp. ATA003 TaxID=3073064 RepID=UPI002873331E|nr:hypothetical protein [Cellulomonas sp. ATA003]WNB85191.1 hypothetical protein REH70_16370 [Cellulomonas sp. ATA003]